MNHRINKAIEHYQLTEAEQLSNSLFTDNYVAKAYSTELKQNVVLKVINTDNNEVKTLKHFDGKYCVKLIDYNKELNACLLEYVSPGTTLKTKFPKHDTEAIEITANLIKKLQEKPLISENLDKFKTIYDFLDQFSDFKSKQIPKEILVKAEKIISNLYEAEISLKLLHGDLHHENILLNNDEWIAIDPKGVFGPIEFEIGRFIINPIPELTEQPNAKKIIGNRINKFCQIFELEKQDLENWTFINIILSAYWAEQDDDQKLLDYFIKLLKIIS
jgi:streptomycin 6-kinase